MPLARRRSAVELALPEGPSAVEVDGVEHPAMLVQRSLRPVLHARVVESLDRRRLLPCSDRGGHEHAVARDDRRTPRQPWNIDGPDDVLGLAPALRQVRIIGNDARGRPPELQPVCPAAAAPATTSSAPSATTTIRCIGSLLRPSPARARGLASHVMGRLRRGARAARGVCSYCTRPDQAASEPGVHDGRRIERTASAARGRRPL